MEYLFHAETEADFVRAKVTILRGKKSVTEKRNLDLSSFY